MSIPLFTFVEFDSIINLYRKRVQKLKNRIKEIRKKKKLTLKEVSEKTGISISSLSAYEKQKGEKGYRYPKIDNWIKLADFFGVPVSYLQGFGEINYNDKEELYKQFKKRNPDLDVPKLTSKTGAIPISPSDFQLRMRDEILNQGATLKDEFISRHFYGTQSQQKKLLKNFDELSEEDLNQLLFDVSMLICIFLDDDNEKATKQLHKLFEEYYHKHFNDRDPAGDL